MHQKSVRGFCLYGIAISIHSAIRGVLRFPARVQPLQPLQHCVGSQNNCHAPTVPGYERTPRGRSPCGDGERSASGDSTSQHQVLAPLGPSLQCIERVSLEKSSLFSEGTGP